MEQRIAERLIELEREENIRVLYACESGSRAWGFPSRDSDYDVRFIYIRPRDWYLSIDACTSRDVIELPIDDALDISGWDLPKALRLLRKSNPPLLEWLHSPIIYMQHEPITSAVREIAHEYYSPMSCAYHYLNMAGNNFREYLRGEMVSLKKYFYVLRPLLAIRWIEAERGIVPVRFQDLVEAMVDSDELRTAIESLRQRKLAGEELGIEPRVEPISAFIESELERHSHGLGTYRHQAPDSAPLNNLFRRALELDEGS